jgi:hypothetical protein
MKALGKSYGMSAIRFIVGCLIAVSIGVVIPAHTAQRLRTFYKPSEMHREMSRHTVLDLTESSQDNYIDSVPREPVPESSLPTLATVALIAPTAPAVAVAPRVLPFLMRRKLLSPRAADPDPLV